MCSGRLSKRVGRNLELLDRLFADEALQKRERIIQRRIREAHFPENKTLESFDWTFNAAVIDRAEIEELATVRLHSPWRQVADGGPVRNW